MNSFLDVIQFFRIPHGIAIQKGDGSDLGKVKKFVKRGRLAGCPNDTITQANVKSHWFRRTSPIYRFVDYFVPCKLLSRSNVFLPLFWISYSSSAVALERE